MTAASLVIFAELDWNPSVSDTFFWAQLTYGKTWPYFETIPYLQTLAQCESRAHRIGQKSPVICRYLLARGTVDDYMWNMVKGKQAVLNKAGIFSEDLTDATHSTVSVSVSFILFTLSFLHIKYKYFQLLEFNTNFNFSCRISHQIKLLTSTSLENQLTNVKMSTTTTIMATKCHHRWNAWTTIAFWTMTMVMNLWWI